MNNVVFFFTLTFNISMAVKYMLCSKKKKQGMLKLMKEREKKINMPTIMKIFGEGGGGA